MLQFDHRIVPFTFTIKNENTKMFTFWPYDLDLKSDVKSLSNVLSLTKNVLNCHFMWRVLHLINFNCAVYFFNKFDFLTKWPWPLNCLLWVCECVNSLTSFSTCSCQETSDCSEGTLRNPATIECSIDRKIDQHKKLRNV